MIALFKHWSGRFSGLSGFVSRPSLAGQPRLSMNPAGYVTLHYLLCDYAIYLMYVGLGYLATICLRYVLFFLVLRKSLRKVLRESLQVHPRFTTRRMLACAMTPHPLVTASRYPSFQVCKTPRRSAKHDSCI